MLLRLSVMQKCEKCEEGKGYRLISLLSFHLLSFRLLRTNVCHFAYSVADLGGVRGVRGVQIHPPLAASNVFCVNNCTSPSNDYTAVACSNNNQAQLHTRVSVPY